MPKPNLERRGSAMFHQQKTAHDTLQAKTFLRWWNSELPVDNQINDLATDLCNGVAPMMLLKELTGAKTKFKANPNSRIQSLENMTHFLKGVEGLGITLTNIGAEDIVDGKLTLVLGLSWKLLQHFAGSGGADGKGGNEELLEWLKQHTSTLGVPIDNWSSAVLTDGRAFCHLLHTYDPKCLDLSLLPEIDGDDDHISIQKATLQAAFDVAQANFGAPQLLDADDVAGKGDQIDPKSLQAYVLKLRQCLRKHAKAQRVEILEEVAALKVSAASLVARAQEAAKKFDQKTATAGELDRSDPQQLAKAEEMLAELDEKWRKIDKPPMHSEAEHFSEEAAKTGSKVALRAEVDARIGAEESTRLASVATAEVSEAASAVSAAWSAVEAAETEYEKVLWALLTEKETDKMVTQVGHEADKIEAAMSAWTQRMSDPSMIALRFEPTADSGTWPEGLDSAAAVSLAVDTLGAWASAEGTDEVAGMGALALQRDACLQKHDEAAKRKQNERRDPPPDVRAKLQAAEAAMMSAATTLRGKSSGLMGWERAQLELRHNRYTAHRALVEGLLGADPVLPAPPKEAAKPGAGGKVEDKSDNACVVM